MARPKFAPTDAIRKKVRSLASQGVPQEVIAKIIECDPKTLRHHFRKELDRGMAEADAKIVGALYRSAIRGNVAAQIFWMKTRVMRWWKPEAPPDPVPDTGGEPRYVVILPDNGRDPELMENYKIKEELFNKKVGGYDVNSQGNDLVPVRNSLDTYRAQLLRTSAYSSILQSNDLKNNDNFYADRDTITNFLLPRRTSYPDRVMR